MSDFSNITIIENDDIDLVVECFVLLRLRLGNDPDELAEQLIRRGREILEFESGPKH